ncbi:hypothetical protein ACLD3Q_16105, partial [Salmonella sp. 741265083_PST]
MLRIVVKRFIIYGGIFSAINFSAWSADNCAFQGIQNFHRQQGIALS